MGKGKNAENMLSKQKKHRIRDLNCAYFGMVKKEYEQRSEQQVSECECFFPLLSSSFEKRYNNGFTRPSWIRTEHFCANV